MAEHYQGGGIVIVVTSVICALLVLCISGYVWLVKIEERERRIKDDDPDDGYPDGFSEY